MSPVRVRPSAWLYRAENCLSRARPVAVRGPDTGRNESSGVPRSARLVPRRLEPCLQPLLVGGDEPGQRAVNEACGFMDVECAYTDVVVHHAVADAGDPC